MARKKNVIAPEAQTMDLIAQKRDENLSAVNQILPKLGILSTEYDFFLFVETAKNLVGLQEKSAIALGAVILAIKEKEQHGTFIKAIEQIDIHPRKAQRYMNIAKRYSKCDNLSHLSTSKLNVLDDLTDPELDMLLEGEEVKGLTLDAIEELSATEAKKRLRVAEAEAQDLRKKLDGKVKSLEAVIKQKSTKIDELEYENRHGEPLSKEKKAAVELRKYQNPIIDNMLEATERLHRATAAIDEAQKIPHIPFEALEKLLEPWKGIFNAFVAQTDDFIDAFNNIHVDKGRG